MKNGVLSLQAVILYTEGVLLQECTECPFRFCAGLEDIRGKSRNLYNYM